MSMIFKKYRFTSKLMIAYLLLTVIPIGILGYISYIEYERSVETQVGTYIPKLLRQSNQNIDRQLEELQNLPELIHNSREMIGILRKGSYQSQSEMLKDRFTIESNLTRYYLSGNYKGLLGVFIASKNRIFQSARVPYEHFDELASLPFDRAAEAEREVRILLPKSAPLTFEGDIPYLLFTKPIYDSDNRTTLGTIYIAVDLQFLKDALDELIEGDSTELWIMDENGQIIYHPDPERIGRRFAEIANFPLKNGSFEKRTAAGGELYSVSQSRLTGWMLTHRIAVEELTGEASQVRNMVFVVFVIMIIVTGAISIFLTWNFTRPINQLSLLMKDVERGNFDVDLQIRSRDEVGMLARRFNQMVREIRDLIRENYQIEIKQKEAELYALQFQINPHFMYNTLETIAMSVEEDEKEKVVEMVTLLGRMLRYSLSDNQSIVPIMKEVQHTEDFLRIQVHRFEEALDYAIHQSIDMDAYMTPKFILQPIVENSIKYGLENRQQLKIDLTIEYVKDYRDNTDAIRFVIRDNGVGMDADRLEQVRQTLREIPAMTRDSGVGLANVHSRILLKFGEPYGVRIDGEEGEGTVTTVIIPALRRSERLP